MSFNDLLAKETAVKKPQKEADTDGRKSESKKKETSGDQSKKSVSKDQRDN